MKYLISFIFSIPFFVASAQHIYSTGNAHSRNNYEQAKPFWNAYQHKFGSIETDVFLLHDSLFVAHDSKELQQKRSLENLYLKPLLSSVKKNNGFAYADTTKQLQLLIDVKTEAEPTLKKLMDVLKKYSSLINCKTLHFVISGNRPQQELFTSYPSYILFDGELMADYSAEALSKIVMLSSDFENYSHWKGVDEMSREDQEKLLAAVDKTHKAGKLVRFWNAPDNVAGWKKLMELKVDYINTDKIEELSNYLEASQ